MKKEKNKKKIVGYLTLNGEIHFVNYLNKTIKTVEINKVVDRWIEEIKEM